MTHETERAAVAASLALDRDRGTYAARRRCFLKEFSDRPCDGRLVRAHLIPKNLLAREFPFGAVLAWHERPGGQTLVTSLVAASRAEGEQVGTRSRPGPLAGIPLAELQDDTRVTAWACGGPMGNAGHHGMLDASRTIRIPRDRLPAGLEEFAAELGLTWWLEREYGL